MLEKDKKQPWKNTRTQPSLKTNSDNTFQDLILSLSHRLTTIQSSLHSKIDRSQCMLILQNKVNHSHLSKILDQLTAKFQLLQKHPPPKHPPPSKSTRNNLQKYVDNIKPKKKSSIPKKPPPPPPSKQKNIFLLKPQQYYLQSNQTMFNLILQQISPLKQKLTTLQKNIQHQNKQMLNINNQLFQKLSKFQHQLQQNCKNNNVKCQKLSTLDQNSQIWLNLQDKQYKNKQKNKSNCQRLSLNSVGLDSHQFTYLMRMIQSIQKQLSHKINIKDILQILKKNIKPLSQLIQQIKIYTQQNIQSTKKILINQSQINQQLSLITKIGWWQSYQIQDGYALWNKQIVNLAPQCFFYQKNCKDIIIIEQGRYAFKVLSANNQLPETVIIGGNSIDLLGQFIGKIDKNTSIQLPSSGNYLFISIQKI